MGEYKVDKQTAEDEFLKWCDSLYIDCDTAEMTSEELDDFNKIKKQIVFAIRKGRAYLNDAGSFVLTLIAPIGEKTELIFPANFNSAPFIRMDRHKEKDSMKKTLSFVAGWAGVDANLLHKMDSKDTKFCLSLTTLFLA